jgi:Na+/proline symporter
MQPADYVVVGAYLLFMLGVGPLYARFNRTASDYFRGGGGMLWWMVGASAWVWTFTAWTFTGGAGKVYETGTFFLLLILGNLTATVFMYLFTAARYRQMRVVTPIEAAYDRFGRISEQWFTWLPLPVNLLRGGMMLYAIGIFMSVVFDLPVASIIVGLGVVVTVMSVFGGAFAVVASDFVQMLTVLAITLVVAVLSLNHAEVGGVSGLLDKVPRSHLDWTVFERPGVLFVFGLTLILNQTVQMNSLMEGAARFLFVKDGRDAKRALQFSFWGTVLFTPVFIVPAMAASVVLPDLGAVYPGLNNPSEAAYVAMAMEVLPVGMLGLLVCGMFAATMSSMDSTLNRTSGIFVRNFWIVFVRPGASERHQVRVGRCANLVLGVAQVFVGLSLIAYQELALFDLMIRFSAVFGLPMAVPLFLGLFVKRTAPWSGWSTMVLGMAAGLLMQPFEIGAYRWGGLITAGLIESLFSVSPPFNDTELNDLRAAMTMGLVLAVCTGWFFLSHLFYASSSAAYKRRVEGFFRRMHTPIDRQAEGVAGPQADQRHYRVLGGLCMLYGLFILSLAAVPNPWWGRLCFVFCGGFIGPLGWVLFRIGRRLLARAASDPRESGGGNGL